MSSYQKAKAIFRRNNTQNVEAPLRIYGFIQLCVIIKVISYYPFTLMLKYRYPATGNLLLYITYIVISFVELMITFRVLLKLFGAHASAPFVAWVYATTAPLLQPFAGMFPSPVLEGGFIIEFSALFAIIVYGAIAYAVEFGISAVSRIEET